MFPMIVNLATGDTAFAIRDFVRKHPDQQSQLSHNALKSVAVWEGTLKWEKSTSSNATEPAAPDA
jgi:hypothetical protein